MTRANSYFMFLHSAQHGLHWHRHAPWAALVLALWTEFGVQFSRELHACSFFHFDSFLILHVSDKRWIPALVVHCGSEAVPFPCTPTSQLTSNLKPTSASADQVSDCGQHASRARLTTWVTIMHAWRVLLERDFSPAASRPS